MNNSMKYIIGTLILLVGVVGISFYSCEKEEITPNATAEPEGTREMVQDESNTIRSTEVTPEGVELISPSDFLNADYQFVESEALCGKAFTKDIMNESGKRIGSSYVFNTDKYFYVWLVMDQGYKMKSANLHMATDARLFPLTDDGKPDYSLFKYGIPDGKEIGRVMNFKIPVEQLNKESIVSVTAEFMNEDNNYHRAWVGTTVLEGSKDLKVFKYTEQECTVDPKDPGAPDSDNADA